MLDMYPKPTENDMRHEIPVTNWASHLAAATRQAEDGDTIVCHTPNMVEFARRAQGRMCPTKIIIWEIQ
jgi:hypothetical protein